MPTTQSITVNMLSREAATVPCPVCGGVVKLGPVGALAITTQAERKRGRLGHVLYCSNCHHYANVVGVRVTVEVL